MDHLLSMLSHIYLTSFKPSLSVSETTNFEYSFSTITFSRFSLQQYQIFLCLFLLQQCLTSIYQIMFWLSTAMWRCGSKVQHFITHTSSDYAWFSGKVSNLLYMMSTRTVPLWIFFQVGPLTWLARDSAGSWAGVLTGL